LPRDRAEPLVRFLPARWNPGAAWQRAGFFEGLDVPWLSGTAVTSVLDGDGTAQQLDPVEEIAYPEEAVDTELPATTLATSERLVDRGRALAELLPENDVVDDAVARQALVVASFWSRVRPGAATRRAREALEVVEGWLGSISVRGPSFVTMSDETGTFQVTVVNTLDQPVQVVLRATVTGGGLTVSSPEPLQLPPRGRGAVRIDATATDIGVHQVVLQPVSEAGTPVGEPTTVSIRSSRVGFILWVIMAVGGGVLFVAIVVRIWRRISRRRRTFGPLLRQARP